MSYKLNKYDNKETNSKLSITIAVLSILFILLGGVAQGCDVNNVKHVEALEGYTQTDEKLVEEADLVDVDGYYAGEGTLNDIKHIRFQAKKDNQISDTIDATSKFYTIYYTDTTDAGDKSLSSMNGKVKAYMRTYKKDNDIKTHYFYAVYLSKDKLKDCGDLGSDSSEGE